MPVSPVSQEPPLGGQPVGCPGTIYGAWRVSQWLTRALALLSHGNFMIYVTLAINVEGDGARVLDGSTHAGGLGGLAGGLGLTGGVGPGGGGFSEGRERPQVAEVFTTECTKAEWLICIGLFDRGRFAPSERSVSVITLMAQDGRLGPSVHGCRKCPRSNRPERARLQAN
jgi:hypothetical protein